MRIPKDKEAILHQIKQNGILVVIRTDTPERAVKIFEACVQGGIKTIEFSFTMSFAAELIKELSDQYGKSGILIGAGTVLDPETAKIALSSGAQYIISPYLNTETAKMCNRYRTAYFPGAMTVKEVAECMEAGADIVKVFPSELFGPAIIKAIKGPLPQAPLMPTGGVTLENIGAWFDAGSDVVGIGRNITRGAENDDYESIRLLSEKFVEKIKFLRRQ
ncbi:MAG: bifunctional 2-keto-4-hydroxyglutarate aldolase/2-keto-3-deoxy-6-phosphogluconate aldolase [Clostridia bacterium]|nr:bifunctional 2-keto-4-hydroxyglutarate aldolase/2-keto-3-deoxy-6-phosphogluconate aldolase [Clostridia bacterium]